MNVNRLIDELTRIKNNGNGEKPVKFRNAGDSGKLCDVDYFLLDDKILTICEEWF